MRSLITFCCILIVGCTGPDMPWNRGVIWGGNPDTLSITVPIESNPPRPIENFCEDNERDVHQYRLHLNQDSLGDRRRRYLREFIEEYKRRCEE
jgi:hypothetical protein